MKDKNGVEIKVGDYVLYSEMPASNYADSLLTIIKHNDEIKLQSLVHNTCFGGTIKYTEYLDPLENCVNIRYAANANGEFNTLEKVDLPRNKTPLDFMNENYHNGVTAPKGW